MRAARGRRPGASQPNRQAAWSLLLAHPGQQPARLLGQPGVPQRLPGIGPRVLDPVEPDQQDRQVVADQRGVVLLAQGLRQEQGLAPAHDGLFRRLLGLHDAEIRASWSQFYDSVRELYVGLIRAAGNAGKLRVQNPRATAEWVLATFEGIKHRASFQRQNCTPAERDAMVDVLLRIVVAAADAAV